jgi:hypothetical protein
MLHSPDRWNFQTPLILDVVIETSNPPISRSRLRAAPRLLYDRGMKHAGTAAFDELTELIAAIRSCGGLREPRPGVFYRKGRAWLHFHEDKAGLFADLRIGAEWERFRVSTDDERTCLLAAIDRAF